MARAVLFDELGTPEVLYVREVPLLEPEAREVRIRVEAIGINRAEAMFRAGNYYEQPTFPSARNGYEASGVIDAVGVGVDDFAVGDRVSTLPAFSLQKYGVYGDQVIVPAAAVVGRPETVDAVTGASVWMGHTTAYGALIERGQLRAGDAVLITAASSGVGLAAIQVAALAGAVPIATTRTMGKRAQLLRAGAAHVIVTGHDDLADSVNHITQGRGADLIFDSIAGPAVGELVTLLAPDSTLIIYGWLDPKPTPLPLTGGNASIVSYGNSFVTGDPARLRRAQHFVNAGLRSGTLNPVIDKVYPDLTSMPDAHRHLESNTQVGKIVVKVAT